MVVIATRILIVLTASILLYLMFGLYCAIRFTNWLSSKKADEAVLKGNLTQEDLENLRLELSKMDNNSILCIIRYLQMSIVNPIQEFNRFFNKMHVILRRFKFGRS